MSRSISPGMTTSSTWLRARGQDCPTIRGRITALRYHPTRWDARARVLFPELPALVGLSLRHFEPASTGDRVATWRFASLRRRGGVPMRQLNSSRDWLASGACRRGAPRPAVHCPCGLKAVLWAATLLAAVHPLQSLAQQEGPALPEDPLTMERMIVSLSDGSITLDTLRRRGLHVFTTSFNTFDGYGDGPFASEASTTELGHRPTLQGNGMTLRVNGLDAQSCNECHSFVKRSTRPPVLGIGGVGGIVQNAIILPTLIDVADSGDARVNYVSGNDPDLILVPDGTADFNGRYANPPFLFGGGESSCSPRK